MNQFDSCQSPANWSVSVQRAWIQLYVEQNALELILYLKVKIRKDVLQFWGFLGGDFGGFLGPCLLFSECFSERQVRCRERKVY